MGYTVFWIVAGIIGGIVAKQKNRSVIGWVILGLLLPIAVLVLFFLPPLAPGGEVLATKECPYCAEIIQAKAIVCKHCGRDVAHREGA